MVRFLTYPCPPTFEGGKTDQPEPPQPLRKSTDERAAGDRKADQPDQLLALVVRYPAGASRGCSIAGKIRCSCNDGVDASVAIAEPISGYLDHAVGDDDIAGLDRFVARHAHRWRAWCKTSADVGGRDGGDLHEFVVGRPD